MPQIIAGMGAKVTVVVCHPTKPKVKKSPKRRKP